MSCADKGREGVWKDRLRNRSKKDNDVNAISKVINHEMKKPRSKAEQRQEKDCHDLDLSNNNVKSAQDQIKEKKKVVAKKLKSEAYVSLSLSPEEDLEVVRPLRLLHVEPKTIKDRMQNRSILKDFNKDYQDDLFRNEKERFSLLQSDLNSSMSSSSSDSLNLSCVVSRPGSPLLYSQLERENTPEWYNSFSKGSIIDLDVAETYKHMAYIHKSMKNNKVKSKRSTEAPIAVKSSSQIKDLLASSSNQIAMLSSDQGQQDDEEGNCEEYFSEEDS